MESDFHTVRGYELKNNEVSKLTFAMEDYIEMIYRHTLDQKYIRVNELAKLLNVKDSSSSKMIQKLSLLNLINYEKYGIVTLTEKGNLVGKRLLRRHNIVEKFLKLLDCSDILKQTELIEHILNDETVEKILLLSKFFDENKDIFDRYLEFVNIGNNDNY